MTYLLVQNPGVAPVEGFTLLGVSHHPRLRRRRRDRPVRQRQQARDQRAPAGRTEGRRLLRQDPPGLPDPRRRDRRRPDPQAGQAGHVQAGRHVHPNHRLGLGARLRRDRLDGPGHGPAEFVSNAIDRTFREENGEFVPAIWTAGCVVRRRDEKIKAKDGYTRVYVEMNAEVQRYVDELPKRFLHFSADPSQVKKSFLPKGEPEP